MYIYDHGSKVAQLVECSSWGQRFTSLRLTGGTVLFPWTGHSVLCLVLVKFRKSGKNPVMTDEKLLTEM